MLARTLGFLAGDSKSGRVVPPTGYTAQLTLFSAAAMAFLAVFALALSLASDRLAARWTAELAHTATLRISAPAAQLAAQTADALRILSETPGVGSARALSVDEQRRLLTPWFGAELPVEDLPLPQLVEISESGDGFDTEGLRLRLRAEVPGAVLDSHDRWRRPLARAAGRLRLLGLASVGLIALTMAAMVTLAANAALAANAQVIGVLRLVGARDNYIARAFVRRFTARAFTGALAGILPAVAALALMPGGDGTPAMLTGLALSGWNWALPFLIPPFAAVIAFWATRSASFRALEAVT